MEKAKNAAEINWSEYQQDDRHQYLMGVSADLDPWILCEFWDIDTACQLITLGCTHDIEKQRAVSKMPVSAPYFKALMARTICEVFDRAKSIAKLSKIADRDTIANWLAWATSKGYSVEHLVSHAAPEQNTAIPAPVVAVDNEEWINQARERATEIIKRQRGKDLYPSQVNLGDEIAREFRAAGIVGADGKPLSGAYIKRHALTGISSAQGKQLSTRIGRGK